MPGGQPAGRAPDQPRRHRRRRGGEHLEPGWRGRRRPGLRRDRGRAGTAVPGPGDHGHGAHRRPAAVMLRELSARHRSWPLAAPFRISRGVKHSAEAVVRSEEHTSELQSLMRISYAVFCLKKKKNNTRSTSTLKKTI